MSKLPALIILIGLGVCSGYLTWEMMIDLGGSLGSPLVFGAAGIFLELAKAYLPMQSAWCFRGGKWFQGVSFGALSLSLIAISFVASFNTMQEGMQSHQAASVANTQIMAQIKSLEEVKASQLAINHVTKAGKTAKEISELYAKLGTEKATELSKHQSLVFGIIAAAIELVGFAMAVIVSGKTENNPLTTGKQHGAENQQNDDSVVRSSMAKLAVVSSFVIGLLIPILYQIGVTGIDKIPISGIP